MAAEGNVADTIREAIEENAKAGLKSASVDGNSATALDIAQQIEADRYLADKTAAGRNHFGLRMVKLQAPGAG